ncbi:AraD1 family protein [Sphingobium sp. OAS761]|uniref:AraD1 family protein n=1 Tax=Sphingobium sp. OAS761 TaxID=2817901 RepID=UPI00209DEC01|nr:AraD1 family protein [Sphingobium sp. OAS761]
MALRLVQLRRVDGGRVLAACGEHAPFEVEGVPTSYDLARRALADGVSLAEAALARKGEPVDLDLALDEGRILPPIDHPDPAHLYLTGTGLTHLGSAEGRDKMHKAAAAGAMTDSLRMFLMGLEGGKPADGTPGVQPEWFYKGDGSCLVPPGAPLISPAFAQDGSEEPEIAGIYIIDDEGVPRRLGFTLANEFSDHVIERGNYLWLAHSKLRQAAIGPELLTGPLPEDVQGMSRIMRDGETVWERPFVTGEFNMAHSIANLEYHHFKYGLFCRPGDVHVHFFGTATLSFTDNFPLHDGDVFEISAAPFGMPLRNPLGRAEAAQTRILPL